MNSPLPSVALLIQGAYLISMGREDDASDALHPVTNPKGAVLAMTMLVHALSESYYGGEFHFVLDDTDPPPCVYQMLAFVQAVRADDDATIRDLLNEEGAHVLCYLRMISLVLTGLVEDAPPTLPPMIVPDHLGEEGVPW